MSMSSYKILIFFFCVGLFIGTSLTIWNNQNYSVGQSIEEIEHWDSYRDDLTDTQGGWRVGSETAETSASLISPQGTTTFFKDTLNYGFNPWGGLPPTDGQPITTILIQLAGIIRTAFSIISALLLFQLIWAKTVHP